MVMVHLRCLGFLVQDFYQVMQSDFTPSDFTHCTLFCHIAIIKEQ